MILGATLSSMCVWHALREIMLIDLDLLRVRYVLLVLLRLLSKLIHHLTVYLVLVVIMLNLLDPLLALSV